VNGGDWYSEKLFKQEFELFFKFLMEYFQGAAGIFRK
jgi:hypothetical protein